MGVNKFTDALLYRYMEIQPVDVDMALIGDLYVRNPVSTAYRRANKYYRSKGFRSATSFDINGQADIKVNLGHKIHARYKNRYRVIINGGTAEHVKNQETFFNNVDAMAKLSALIIHVGPEQGSFIGHSEVYYTVEFFEWMAKKYRYLTYSIDRIKHGKQGWAIYAAFKK